MASEQSDHLAEVLGAVQASQASAFHFLVPIFGIVQSAIIFNERITMPDVLGILIVSISLMLMNRPPAITVGRVPTCSLEPNQTRRSDKKYWLRNLADD